MKSVKLVGIFFLLISKSFSQEIQWASEVVDQIDVSSKTEFPSYTVLGKPDAQPYGKFSENAIRINSESGFESLTLAYENPQHVREIIIVENYLPGQISMITLYDTDENAHNIYESPRIITLQPFNILAIKIDKTSYKVKKITIHINAYINQGWSQIDAVGICEEVYGGDVISDISVSIGPDLEEYTFLQPKERLGDIVNSKYSESKPVISPDGKILYFVKKNNPNNLGKRRDDQDIYFSELINGEWSPAQNAGQPLNDRLSNGICSVSPDGNSLMVINAYYEDGSVEKGVSISKKTETGWSTPINQEIEDYYNINDFEDYFKSNSGEVLISAIQRGDSKGDLDLYVSFRTGENSWSLPENMGSGINTSKIDYAPFLTADNKTLYFSSNGHSGFGKSDIFYSKRLDDTWTYWSTPINLGEFVNSSNWDGYYTITAKGDYAYFVSAAVTLNEADFDPSNEDIYRISLTKKANSDPVVIITGTVLDSKTNKPLEAEIFYKSVPINDEEGTATSDPKDGSYKIAIPTGKKYNIRVEVNGYIIYNKDEDYTMIEEYTEITKDLDLTPLIIGKQFN